MHYQTYKKLLSPHNGMNIYRGCTHGCIYCDSRSLCYRMDHVFEDIEVKRDAPKMLEAELRKKRAPCMIGTGSMCDPYIPLERELCYTQKCLEVIEHLGFGAAVLTKSTLILRDMALLKRINERAKCVVQMTLTTFDEALCRILEPHVSTTKERFEALNALREEGIPTVVWLSPILPFINDTEENLRGVLSYCISAGVRGIVYFGAGVTLRDGDREYFYRALDAHFPGLKRRYVQTYGNAYEVPSPRAKVLDQMVFDTCRTHGILCTPGEVFSYLNELPPKSEQLTMF